MSAYDDPWQGYEDTVVRCCGAFRPTECRSPPRSHPWFNLSPDNPPQPFSPDPRDPTTRDWSNLGPQYRGRGLQAVYLHAPAGGSPLRCRRKAACAIQYAAPPTRVEEVGLRMFLLRGCDHLFQHTSAECRLQCNHIVSTIPGAPNVNL